MMETEEDKNILDSKHKQFQTRLFNWFIVLVFKVKNAPL